MVDDENEWRGRAFDNRKGSGEAVLKYLSSQGNTISDESCTPQAARQAEQRAKQRKEHQKQEKEQGILYFAEILQESSPERQAESQSSLRLLGIIPVA
jgi:hypothetical protein